MNDSRILVCIFSDANFLALTLLENLLSKSCTVYVVTNSIDSWNNLTNHLSNKSFFTIGNVESVSDTLSFDYTIFCGGFIVKDDYQKSFIKFLNYKKLRGKKNLALFPFETYSPNFSNTLRVDDDLSVIYMGDLIGPRINLESNLLLSETVSDIFYKRELTLPVGEVFYPIFITDAVRTLTKWLLSFGPYGKELFLMGQRVSSSDYWGATQKIVGEIKIKYDDKRLVRPLPRNYEVKTIPSNLAFGLTEMYTWVARNYQNNKSAGSKAKYTKTKEEKNYPKFLRPTIIFILSVVVFPFITLVIATVLSFVSYKNFSSGNQDITTNTLLASKTFFAIGEKESGVLSFIPLIGLVYRETGYLSLMGKDATEIAISGMPLIKTSQKIIESVLGDSVYDISPPSMQMGDGLKVLYDQVSNAEADTNLAKGKGVLSAKLILAKVDFARIKNYLVQGSELSNRLPYLLGKGSRKSYLVLFQNNMELRPTGGFIGSFGILTFDSGRMTDLAVNDVYSADGQLKGHVEPPVPIKKYLNEANWWLRDSNWDPDFPTSAQRAEWFLDKEVDQKVDGVIGIDLDLIRDILKINGPVFLADYNLNITSDNLYEKTQAEAQEEFFPGSYQKASFLTALSRNLIGSVEKQTSGQKFLVARSLFQNLNERHIQAFIHDDASQSTLSRLGWTGEVSGGNCGGNCYADLVGLVEANVGVNKSNYFISRNVDVGVNISKEGINRKLSLTLKNSANTALGPSGTYKDYVRVLVPSDTQGVVVKGVVGEDIENLQPEITDVHGHKEIGVYIEVLGGQSKAVEFNWVSPILSPGVNSYGVFIRKQAGVTDDPWHLSLTGQGKATYNTVLARDFFSRIDF